MKHTHLFVLLLAMAGTAARAHDITTGYYTIEGKDAARYQYLYNDPDHAGNDNHFTLQAQTLGTTNNYIWHVTVDGNNLAIVNGQGTPIKANVNGGEVLETLTVEAATDGYVAFTERLNASNGKVFKLADGTPTVTTWVADASTTNAADNNWKFVAVTGKDFYEVVIANAPEGAKVSYGSEIAFNGGFFAVATGTALTAADFTAAAVEGYTGNVAVAGKVITATYTFDASAYRTALQQEIADAKAVQNIRGVGYPTTESEAYSQLSSAITTAEGETVATIDGTEIATLDAAVSAYKSATTGIQMPEDGKAYTITSVVVDGTKRYMNYTDAGYQIVDHPGGTLPITAVLICRDMGEGKYTFVNNAGKYFMWRGSNAGNNEVKGYADTFDTTNESSNTVVSVQKMITGGHTEGTPQDAFFGYMAISGNRNDGGTPNFFVLKTGGGYDQADAMFFSAGYSSALLIEEVTYPNTPELKNASNLGTAVATWSAPFATVVPKGVMAYIVNSQSTSKVGVSYVAGEGEAIPANTGVLLGGAAGKATMVPATTETVAAVDGNLLEHSAGSTTTTVNGKYILADKSGKVAFYPVTSTETLGMNKAFLNLSGTSVREISFDFDATAIHDVEAKQNSVKTYDLSGRLVKKAGKGIFIRNGKKVILK